MRDAIIGGQGKSRCFDGGKKPFVGNLTGMALNGATQVEREQQPLQYDTYHVEKVQLARSMYSQLTIYTGGTPLGIVFEAHRRLAHKILGTWARPTEVLEFDSRSERLPSTS